MVVEADYVFERNLPAQAFKVFGDKLGQDFTVSAPQVFENMVELVGIELLRSAVNM